MALYVLRFVKGGQVDYVTQPVTQTVAFELIRDYVGMAWVLLSIETMR